MAEPPPTHASLTVTLTLYLTFGRLAAAAAYSLRAPAGA